LLVKRIGQLDDIPGDAAFAEGNQHAHAHRQLACKLQRNFIGERFLQGQVEDHLGIGWRIHGFGGAAGLREPELVPGEFSPIVSKIGGDGTRALSRTKKCLTGWGI